VDRIEAGEEDRPDVEAASHGPDEGHALAPV
jgi:hypothetical protein